MKKVYIAPDIMVVKVMTENALLNDSVRIYDKDGNLDEWHQVIEGDLDEGEEVGAKGDGFSGGIGVWED